MIKVGGNNNYNRIVSISGGWYFLNAGYCIRRGVTIRLLPTTHIMVLSTPTTICLQIR